MGSSGQMDVLGFTRICVICELSMKFETHFLNTIFLTPPFNPTYVLMPLVISNRPQSLRLRAIPSLQGADESAAVSETIHKSP